MDRGKVRFAVYRFAKSEWGARWVFIKNITGQSNAIKFARDNSRIGPQRYRVMCAGLLDNEYYNGRLVEYAKQGR